MLSNYLASAYTKVVKTQMIRAAGFSRTRASSLFTNQGKNSVIPMYRPHYSRQFSSKSSFGIQYMLSDTDRQFRVRPFRKEINQKKIQKKRHMSSTAGSGDVDYIMLIMSMDKTQVALLVNFTTMIVGGIFGFWKLSKQEDMIMWKVNKQEEMIHQQEEMTLETKRKTITLDQKLTAQAKIEEQKRKAQASVDKARRPLLISAMQLLAKIHNIQHSSFFSYLRDDKRKEIAMQSTLYDFSQYWCLSNKLHLEVDLLHFDNDNDTPDSDSQRIDAKLNDVTRMCSTDRDTNNLMMWKIEQRAVGELMLDDKGEPLGFCAFTKEYMTGNDWGLKKCLKNFESDLEELETTTSDTIRKETNGRLTELGKKLSELVRLLDKDNSILTVRQDEMVKTYQYK